MKVTWTPQKKTDTEAEALEISIAKWRFFGWCTEGQLKEEGSQIENRCGLCIWMDDKCKICIFESGCYEGSGDTCVYEEAKASYREYLYEGGALKAFHAAARKVWEKLKSLR